MVGFSFSRSEVRESYCNRSWNRQRWYGVYQFHVILMSGFLLLLTSSLPQKNKLTSFTHWTTIHRKRRHSASLSCLIRILQYLTILTISYPHHSLSLNGPELSLTDIMNAIRISEYASSQLRWPVSVQWSNIKCRHMGIFQVYWGSAIILEYVFVTKRNVQV